MPYGLFISYSRRDNERGLAAPERSGGGQVTALEAQNRILLPRVRQARLAP